MILTSLALALTPAELQEAVPDARAYLEQCETGACEAARAAESAFVVAMGHYLQTGVADGELAAVVRSLDVERFSDLPEVLQDAATEAPPWVEDLGVWVGTTSIGGKEVHVQRVRLPPVSGPLEMEIAVTDATGVVPWAQVRLGTRVHRVDPKTGTLRAAGAYEGREKRVFTKGETVEIEVHSAGHHPATMTVVLAGKAKRNRFRVQLEPLEIPTDAPETLSEAYELWRMRESQVSMEPSSQAEELSERARRRLQRETRRWDHPFAAAICTSTGEATSCPQ